MCQYLICFQVHFKYYQRLCSALYICIYCLYFCCCCVKYFWAKSVDGYCAFEIFCIKIMMMIMMMIIDLIITYLNKKRSGINRFNFRLYRLWNIKKSLEFRCKAIKCRKNNNFSAPLLTWAEGADIENKLDQHKKKNQTFWLASVKGYYHSVMLAIERWGYRKKLLCLVVWGLSSATVSSWHNKHWFSRKGDTIPRRRSAHAILSAFGLYL